jgi:hypothetical protein
MTRRVLALTALSGLAVAAHAGPYDGQMVVRATISDTSQLLRVSALAESFWSHRIGPGEVDVQVTRDARDAMESLGIRTVVLIPDLQAAVDAERRRIDARPEDDAWYADFHDLAGIDGYGLSLVTAHPTLASRQQFGTTLEGRPMYALRVSAPDSPGNPRALRPQVVFNACQHAREWATPPVALYIAERLVSDYPADARVRALMETVEFIIVPMTNPDGYAYTWSTQRLWRKNRRDNGNGTFGIDLNRNWSVGWGGNDGSSSSPSSDTYRGPAAFSEPETTALRDYMLGLPRVLGNIDIHSYGQLLLSPWGYTVQPPADAGLFRQLDQVTEPAIQAPFGTDYSPGQTSTILYIASGTATDWGYGALGGLGYSVEVRDTGQFGFLLPAAQILPNAIENYRMALAYTEFAAAPLRFSFPSGLPTTVAPGVAVTLDAAIEDGAGELDMASPTVYWRQAPDTTFRPAPMQVVTGRTFRASLPALACGRGLEYYFSAATTAGAGAVSPAGAPGAFNAAEVVSATTLYDDPCEAAAGWTVGAAGDAATTGIWGLMAPQATAAQPGADHSPSGTRCWVTDGRAGAGVGTYDVDGGATTLTSPRFSAAGVGEVFVSYWRWYSNNQGSNPGTNTMPVLISADDGATWTELESVSENANAWVQRRFRIADFVTPTDRMRLRFVARDLTGAIVEAGVDDVRCESVGCPADPADFNGDGFVDFFDYDDFVRCFESGVCPPGRTADFNGDGFADFFDYDDFVRAFEGG